MKTGKSITTQILLITLLAVTVLVGCLILVMTRFMNSLTDTILLNMLRPMSKTAAQSVEGNLHMLADRFLMLRDNSVFSSDDENINDIQAELDQIKSGIEFVWLGIYETGGALLTGSENCPRSLAGRELCGMMLATENLVIEDTSVGNSGLEILVGAPVLKERPSPGESETEAYISYFLVGSYKYDVLNDVLKNINVGANGTAFIINDKGIVIAHKDQGRVYGGESISDTLGSSGSAQDVIVLMEHGQTGSSSVNSPEGQQFVSYSPIRGTNWSLGILAPRSDFVATVQQAIFTSFCIALVLFIIFAAIFNIAVRKIITAPLHAITKNASKLAKGQFENRLPSSVTKREDEIGLLGAAFITMSDSIRNVIVDIRGLTRATRAGSLNERSDISKHQGDYNLIIAGINATLDVMCSHLNALPGALAMFDADQKPIYINQAMYEILDRHGLHTDDESLLAFIVSSGAHASLEPEAASLFSQKSFDHKNNYGATYESDINILDRDGSERNYTLSLRRIGGGPDNLQGDDINAVCVMLILNDVTVQTQARKEAEAASHAKSDFLSRMSHEMRTPMNAIIGMTNIGKSSKNAEKKDYCLGKIDDASKHLLGVINDILDMSKIEANKFELSFAEFSFEKMLQKVVNVNNFRVDERNQVFSVYVDKNIPDMLIGDDQRLTQVITNLLSNAVKFTPEEGSIRLTAKLVKEEDNVCTIEMMVTDTGIGISEEQQSRLFKSFEQAESGTARKFGGTGLGLAISKRIVEMMGGRIWIESELGKGSTFAFTIQAEKGKDKRQILLRPGVNWSNIRILMVDDDADIREYFREIVQQLNITCDTVESGVEACKAIEKNGSYDLYFVDWKMPGMNGIELSRRIKEDSADKSVVIMISSTEWSFIEDEAKNAGVDKFLPKPLFSSSIADCINECLGAEILITSENADTNEIACFEGNRILLVEDVEINREIVIALLEPTMLEIDCAENGIEAVDKFGSAPDRYDMIFMDVHMPEMDGYEATRCIRALDNTRAKQIPIVAMTANVFREDIEKCLLAGMNDHVGKPLDIEDVLAKLRKYLPQR